MTKKNKKQLSPEEQFELELQQEVDLARLQRQHRLLERDRNAVGGTGKMAKQQRVIKILKREHNNVMADLLVATSPAKKKNDAEVMLKLKQLLAEHDYLDVQIKEKKMHLREMDEHIQVVKKQVFEVESKQITDYQYIARVSEGQNTLAGLENKLDTIIKQFCTILTENRKLREEIEHLLLERADFNKMWDRFISNLNKGKKFMMDLIEQATIAYDQRDEWCSKLQALRMRGHTDLILHTQEMQSLQRHLDHESKVQDFIGTKGQKRLMIDLEAKELKKRQMSKEKMQNLLDKYQEMLAQIMEFTGVRDIDQLARLFIEKEERNFATFKHITELHTQMETLGDGLRERHSTIDEQRAITEKRAEQQKTDLENLQAELDQITSEANTAEAELEDCNFTLSELMEGVKKLFDLVNCSNSPFARLLGDNMDINKYNVMMYLQVLEKRVNQLITGICYKQKTAPKKAKAEQIIKEERLVNAHVEVDEMVTTNPCPLCVEQENVSDVIDTMQYVQHREQVQTNLDARLTLPDASERLHNVSACHLPKSRQIIQRRYQ